MPELACFQRIAGGGKDGADNLTDCLFVVDYENSIGHNCFKGTIGDFTPDVRCRK